jgi:hypothetical protein
MNALLPDLPRLIPSNGTRPELLWETLFFEQENGKKTDQ